MKIKSLVIITLLLSCLTGSASAYNPDQVQQLINTLECQNCDLSNAGLQDLDLSGANLKQANLNGVDLRGADLSDAQLQGATLHAAKLGDANLTGATGVKLAGAILNADTILPDGQRYGGVIEEGGVIEDVEEKHL
ncbi:MAG: pentapeptide repeat-containing protein [Pseudanabaenales cyanobacterium]|nr:pentapeptide repeat-containing protein [Pseudanabaenales cyanobacterium]